METDRSKKIDRKTLIYFTLKIDRTGRIDSERYVKVSHATSYDAGPASTLSRSSARFLSRTCSIRMFFSKKGMDFEFSPEITV